MKRKNNILFNIGLEGNPRSTMEILDGLKYIFGGVDHFAEVLGQWDGKQGNINIRQVRKASERVANEYY